MHQIKFVNEQHNKQIWLTWLEYVIFSKIWMLNLKGV